MISNMNLTTKSRVSIQSVNSIFIESSQMSGSSVSIFNKHEMGTRKKGITLTNTVIESEERKCKSADYRGRIMSQDLFR